MKEYLFNWELKQTNTKRILIFGFFYTCIEIIGLTLSTLGYFETDIRFYVAIVVGFHVLYLPFLNIYRKKTVLRNQLILDIFVWIYSLFILLWASVFNVLMYLHTEDITVYTIAILVLASFLTLKPGFSRLLFGGCFVIFAGLIYINASKGIIANALAFKALLVSLIAYLISSTNYKNRYSLHESEQALISANRHLKNLALKDSLTGLYNNGYAFDFLEKAIKKSRDGQQPLSLLMIDIDNFKAVNDTYGHPVGDEVIKMAAKTMAQSIRSDAVIARYGGEEFIVILPNTNCSTAEMVSERILSKIRSLVVNDVIKFTISIGIAQRNEQESMSELIKKADDNLYQAKHNGKDRFVS